LNQILHSGNTSNSPTFLIDHPLSLSHLDFHYHSRSKKSTTSSSVD
jgi:hypothetical protein